MLTPCQYRRVASGRDQAGYQNGNHTDGEFPEELFHGVLHQKKIIETVRLTRSQALYCPPKYGEQSLAVVRSQAEPGNELGFMPV